MIKLMSKSIISFFFIFLMLTSANSEVLRNIEINGNKRISKEAIVMFGDIIINEDIGSDELNIILKKLYETTFFKDIAVNLSNGTLRINIVENPIIQTLQFNGIKKKSIKEALLEKIKIKDRSPYIENLVSQDINMVTNILRSLGYYFAQIELLKQFNDNNTISLISAFSPRSIL